MSTLGSLVVSLAANTAEFQKDLGKAAHEADKRMKDIGDAAEKAGKLMTTAFAASVAGLVYFTRQAANSADTMYKLGQATGLTTEAFSEYNYAASLSGVSTEGLSTALGRLNRNISDTAAGTGEAKEAFKAIGISVMTAEGALKNADQVLLEVADQFARFEDGAGKSALAIQLFGRAGAQMIPMLNQGSAGLKALRDEAKALGATIDSDTGKAAEKFNDNLQRLNTVKQGLANTILRDLLPQMNMLTDSMVNAAKEGDHFNNVARGARIIFETLVILGSDVAFVFKGIGTGIGVAAARLEALARLDFTAFKVIGTEAAADLANARAELDAFQKRIMNIVPAAEQATAGVESLRKAPAPLIQATKDTDLATRQFILAMEEEVKTMAEAAAATDLYAARIRALGADELGLIEISAQRRLLEMEAVSQMSVFDEAERVREEERLAHGVFVSEEEKKRYEERMKVWFDFIDRENEAYEEGLRRQNELNERYLSEREKFTRMHWSKQASTIFGEMENITRGVAQHNKFLFNVNKVSAIANAILSAYEGISLTLSKYPYPFNIAMAALHGVAAFAQVNAIRSTSFEGGGGGFAPSVAGTAAAPPVTPIEPSGGGRARGQSTIIQLHGDVFSREGVRRLIEQLNEEQEDGGRIVLA